MILKKIPFLWGIAFLNFSFGSALPIDEILRSIEASIKVYGVAKEAYDYVAQSRAAAHTGTGGSVGYVESGIGGRETCARVGELETEGVLDVKKNVRILHNFNRVEEQVKNLNAILDKETKAQEKVKESLSIFKSCISDNFSKILITSPDGGKISREEVTEIRHVRTCIDEFVNLSKKIVEEAPLKDGVPFKDLPSKSKDQLSEIAGKSEFYSGLSAVHSRLRELEKGVLEVQYGVRARDNFNRVRNQVISIEEAINGMVSKRKEEMKPAKCILKTWKKILQASGKGDDIVIEKDIFGSCYGQKL